MATPKFLKKIDDLSQGDFSEDDFLFYRDATKILNALETSPNGYRRFVSSELFQLSRSASLRAIKHDDFLPSLCMAELAIKALSDDAPPIQAAARRSLNEITSAAWSNPKIIPVLEESIVPQLIDLLQSEDHAVRHRILIAMADLRPWTQGVVPTLRRLAKNDSDAEIRALAKECLESLHEYRIDKSDREHINELRTKSALKEREHLATTEMQPPKPAAPQQGQAVDSETRAEWFEKLTEPVPKAGPYKEQADAWAAVKEGFEAKFATGFLDTLKVGLRERTWTSYEDKKELVKWTNAELRRFGLAIKHPKTDGAASLSAKKGNDEEIGIFQLSGEDENGKERTFSTSDLDGLLKILKLIEAPARREALQEWNIRVGRHSSNPTRA